MQLLKTQNILYNYGKHSNNIIVSIYLNFMKLKKVNKFL